MLRIIIVSWNVVDLVKECVESIIRETHNLDYEIIVVDNKSKDGTPEILRKLESQFSQVHIILNDQNRGFAAGCNQGIQFKSQKLKVKSQKYYLLLNPDTKIQGGVFKQMVDWMEVHPKAGISGCKLTNPDGSLQPSVRRFPTFFSQLLIALKITHFTKSLTILKKYYWDDFDYSKPQSVDQVMGAFFLMSNKCLKEIGQLDERFFIWFEEVDMCKRAIKAGWQVWYVPITGVTHIAHSSFKKEVLYLKQWYFFSSMIKYFLKHKWT